MAKKLFLLLLLLAPAGAAAQGVSRVDPRLWLARRLAGAPAAAAAGGLRDTAALRADLPGRAAPGAGILPLARDASGRTWLRTLARVAPGGEAALAAAGAQIGVRAGDVVTALLPLEALERVAALPALRYLEAATILSPAVEPLAPPTAGIQAPAPGSASPFQLSVPATALLSPLNDLGLEGVDVSALRQREGATWFGLAGQRVVVGIYDSGLDLSHADFSGPDGTRVRWLWDQGAPGPGPGRVGAGSWGYGRECDRAQVRAGSCAENDIVGHGTHLTGTAAGSGAATGRGMPAWRYSGVAPAADLVIVKGGNGSYGSDQVVDGVAWIFERARQLGEPAVVNLSIGSQDGPHDGSTNFERALDALLGPGRLLAAAAGNDAQNRNESPAYPQPAIHAGGQLNTAASAAFDLVVPAYAAARDSGNDLAVLELWYDGRDSLALVITTPGGRRIRVATGDTALVRTAEGAIVADNASGGTNPNNGAREAMIGLADLDPAAPPASGRWHVEVEATRVAGSGRWDAWLVGSTLRTPAQPTTLAGADVRNAVLVAAPGSTTRAITVAAWAGRHAWTTAGGVTQAYPFQEPLGDIAFFSSPGPRRDGLPKPDIAAPGKVVLSSMSRDAGALWKALPAYVDADSAHAVLMGTSMATPFVTGSLALLLQLRPTLTPEEARAILTGAARQDAFTRHPFTGDPDAAPNAQWGYGKLDIAAAVRRLGLPAGSLKLEVLPQPDAPPVAGRAGARLDLLRLRLTADSAEAQQVLQLAFDLVGRDTAAELQIVRDDDHDGAAGPAETVVARAAAPLPGAPLRVALQGPIVPAGTTRDFVVALRLGPGVPNGTRFGATYRPADLRTRGTLSGEEHRTAPASEVASPRRATTVLLPGETLNLSQNPVLAPPLVVNYAERPRAIRIYALTGSLVRTLAGAELEDGRALWNLDNERGAPVAAGIYLLVLDAPSGPITRKLLVRR